jgi:hypothetical protein
MTLGQVLVSNVRNSPDNGLISAPMETGKTNVPGPDIGNTRTAGRYQFTQCNEAARQAQLSGYFAPQIHSLAIDRREGAKHGDKVQVWIIQ